MSFVWYSVVLVFLHQAGYITASVAWPEGFYSLLKPKTGCPEEWTEKQWNQNCFINQDTVNNKTNEISEVLHIDGEFHDSSVKRHFCIKTKWSGPKWPKGRYCIYSKYQLYSKSQPLTWGTIRMYNELNQNQDSISKPCKNHFVFKGYRYITLHFSCQTSGNKKIPISLPITKPFYLLPYGSRDCQQVKWMVATSEWIKYQTRNFKGKYYKSKTVPYHELGASSRDRRIKMYYCHYKSCNYTLTDKKGVFQSPGFPGKYPDGQLCSWRIMVPDNHTLRVRFTHFSLYEYDKDCLEIYENNNDIIKLKYAIFGHQRPFTITATSDLMFVFRSDEENNSNGFRALYGKETTMATAPKPPTTTTPHSPKTKTKFMTTKQPTTKQSTTALQTVTIEAKAPLPITNANLTTKKTLQCNMTLTKNKSYNTLSVHQMKKSCSCDEAWRRVVMVIPLAVFILIVLVIIDICCRFSFKLKALRSAGGSSADDEMVINPIYERGNIFLNQPTDFIDASTVNTVDDQSQPRDEPPNYENVNYTQLNNIPPKRKSSPTMPCTRS